MLLETGKFHWSAITIEEVGWSGSLELFPNDGWTLGVWGHLGVTSLLPSPTSPEPSRLPSGLGSSGHPAYTQPETGDLHLPPPRDEPTPTSPLGWFAC